MRSYLLRFLKLYSSISVAVAENEYNIRPNESIGDNVIFVNLINMFP